MAELYPILPGAAPPGGGVTEVGNKAWNLIRMAGANLPVPAGFVLPTAWCDPTLDEDRLRQALTRGTALLEEATGLSFGTARRPLLVSVRSGAAVSMPGMMETVLDIGLNLERVEGLIRHTGNPRLAWDSFRRLVQGFAEVVAELPTAPFDTLVTAEVTRAGVDGERDLDHRSLRALSMAMLALYAELAGASFPMQPAEQLAAAAQAVLRSWSADKAVSYRRINALSDAAGTAVTVQAMVYGNAGGSSGAGVGFTRNPATGEPGLYFDFQFNAQGEDVVAGRQRLADADLLRRTLPDIWDRLNTICPQLEALFGDAQDFEFTVQDGVLYLLQARRAKRTDWAALNIAVDLVAEGVLTPAQALATLQGIDLAGVARTSFAEPVPAALATAIAAGPGVASGAIALDTAAAIRLGSGGQPVILVRRDTVTSDIEGMAVAAGILTASGGRTSHAAVVARQLGRVCLVGCADLEIDLEARQCRIGGMLLDEGDMLSLDGNAGVIHSGVLRVVTEQPEPALATIAGWRAATS